MKLFLFVILGAFVGAAAHAGSPGGSDWCGLGWEITKKKSFLATTTRGTTNMFVPPTFGMTTGTIGCDQHSLAQGDIPAAQFVASHYDALMMDMAMGEGEAVTALAQSMGCSNATNFGEMTRRNFSDLTDGASALELVKRIREQAKKDASLGCSA
jgi:hypothetical protein